jgi:hypothetical protein
LDGVGTQGRDAQLDDAIVEEDRGADVDLAGQLGV